jgi:hypothetical protein
MWTFVYVVVFGDEAEMGMGMGMERGMGISEDL